MDNSKPTTLTLRTASAPQSIPTWFSSVPGVATVSQSSDGMTCTVNPISNGQTHLSVRAYKLAADVDVVVGPPQPQAVPLFGPNGPQFTDAIQGPLADCYLISSLAETALRNPEFIEQSFTDNGDGTYTIRYYTDDQPYSEPGTVHSASVDASFPVNYADHSKVLWVALFEKLCATLSGGYANLRFGFPNATLTKITGSKWLMPTDGSFNALTEQWGAGDLICLTTPTNPASGTIVPNHCYALLNCDRETETLALYNPWGIQSQINWQDVSGNFNSIGGVESLKVSTPKMDAKKPEAWIQAM